MLTVLFICVISKFWLSVFDSIVFWCRPLSNAVCSVCCEERISGSLQFIIYVHNMYKISIVSTVCEQALFTLYHMSRSDIFPHRRAPAYLLDLVHSQNIVYSVRAWILWLSWTGCHCPLNVLSCNHPTISTWCMICRECWALEVRGYYLLMLTERRRLLTLTRWTRRWVNCYKVVMRLWCADLVPI